MTAQTMNEMAAPGRDTSPKSDMQVPPGWSDTQESLAAAAGLALLLVKGHQPPALAVSNNNSICQAFQSSSAHVHLCDPYCGRAFDNAHKAGTTFYYRCHAGLECFATPVELVKGEKLAVIGGRAFLTSADYRALAERFRIGDLQELLSSDIFKNVIFAARQDLVELSKRLAEAVEEYQQTIAPSSPSIAAKPVEEAASVLEVEAARLEAELSETTRAGEASAVETQPPPAQARPAKSGQPVPFDYLPLDEQFIQVCGAAVKALAEKHGLASVALLLRDKIAPVIIFATGRFKNRPPRIEIGPKDTRLLLTARAGTSLPLCEDPEGLKPFPALNRQEGTESQKVAELFPLVVGDEVKGALLVAEPSLTEAKRRAIFSFCHDNALPFEVLRLRSELEQRARFADLLQTFTELINVSDPSETYRSILRHSVELLNSERGSILLFDEGSNELTIKATVGPHTKQASEARVRLGEGVSGTVLRDGRPLLVRDIESTGSAPAPAERRYKTKSFISYPIIIGGRKVGVLNVTDKTGGGPYDEIDLGLLETIGPQLALALDRAEWREKAAQFELMSITDPLTGLLNRRYLEQRLMEEVNRSQRHGYAMSFMMIDIDDFKHYNDLNGHQAGDLALEMTAQCLKSVLRSADVASRYGGEEFSILLPQTTLDEALAIAERIRRRVERARFPHGKTQPLGAVTVSIGVSAFTPSQETPEKIIGAADRALYTAKRHGKNRVHSHEPTHPESTENAPVKAEKNPKGKNSTSDAVKDAS